MATVELVKSKSNFNPNIHYRFAKENKKNQTNIFTVTCLKL